MLPNAIFLNNLLGVNNTPRLLLCTYYFHEFICIPEKIIKISNLIFQFHAHILDVPVKYTLYLKESYFRNQIEVSSLL
jgi:hypothetical protein